MKRLLLFTICYLPIALFAQSSQTGSDYIARRLQIPLLDSPLKVSNASVSVSGNPGPATYFYWIVTNGLAGASSPAGPFQLSNAPNTLTGSNFNQISWATSLGAVNYDILRTSTPGPPFGACNCAVATAVTGNTTNDQANALNAYTVNTFDPSTLVMTITHESLGASSSNLVFRSGGVKIFQVSSAGAIGNFGPFTFNSGTVGAPGLAFTADSASGFYLIGAGHWGLSLSGANNIDFQNLITIFNSGQGKTNVFCTSINNPDAGISRSAAGILAIGNCTAGDASGTIKAAAAQLNGPVTGASLNGAASGNSVTLVDSQDALAPVTGNGTDQTLYTKTIPANTIQAGKGFRIRASFTNNNNVSPTVKLFIGATATSFTPAATATQSWNMQWEVFNKAGVQNAQQTSGWFLDGGTILSDAAIISSAENFANAITIKITANEANPNTVTPQKWIVELIQ